MSRNLALFWLVWRSYAGSTAPALCKVRKGRGTRLHRCLDVLELLAVPVINNSSSLNLRNSDSVKPDLHGSPRVWRLVDTGGELAKHGHDIDAGRGIEDQLLKAFISRLEKDDLLLQRLPAASDEIDGKSNLLARKMSADNPWAFAAVVLIPYLTVIGRRKKFRRDYLPPHKLPL